MNWETVGLIAMVLGVVYLIWVIVTLRNAASIMIDILSKQHEKDIQQREMIINGLAMLIVHINELKTLMPVSQPKIGGPH